MYALTGYIDKNGIIANENISSFEGCNVIITILDTLRDGQSFTQMTDEHRKAAAKNLAGLWKNRDDERTAQEAVRDMRKGRSFGI